MPCVIGYFGIDVSPTSLSQWSTLPYLLIFIMYKNIIYYYFHTFSLMYTAWCVTLYLILSTVGHTQFIIVLTSQQNFSIITIHYYDIFL